MSDEHPAHTSTSRRMAPPVAKGRLATVEVTIIVQQTTEVLFTFLADQRNRRLIIPSAWSDFIVTTPRSRGVGARAAYTYRLPWRNYPMTVETVALEPPALLTERVVGAGTAFEIQWQLEPLDEQQTRVTLRSRYVPAGGAIGFLWDALVSRRLLRQSYRQELVRLKREVE